MFSTHRPVSLSAFQSGHSGSDARSAAVASRHDSVAVQIKNKSARQQAVSQMMSETLADPACTSTAPTTQIEIIDTVLRV